jgi:mono/diheme cytochrome c family protein
MRRAEIALAAGALLLGARAARAFPWSHDMFRGAAVQPFAVAPRNEPAGSLAVGGEPPLPRDRAETALRDPLAPTPAHLARGAALFETVCAPCHGRDGTGQGPIAPLMAQPPPDLTFAQPAERSDGYLYATIRNGGVVMPAYGDALSPTERWEVVLHLRALQGKLEAAR